MLLNVSFSIYFILFCYHYVFHIYLMIWAWDNCPERRIMTKFSFSASGKEFYFSLKIVVKDTFAKNISIQGL